MIKYSSKAARAIGFLKQAYNDVEIYVEDTGNHNMWMAIIRKCLPAGTRLKSVNLLGGRRAVMSACRADQANDGRRKLYIIDADFDLALGKRKPQLKFLYRIRGYCVENILICKEAVADIAQIFQPTWNATRIATELDFDRWLNEQLKPLSSLFHFYAAAHKVRNSVQTVGYAVQNLYNSTPKGVTISHQKTLRRIISLSKQASTLSGRQAFSLEVKAVRKRAERMRPQDYISAKDYIFPAMRIYFKSVFNCTFNEEQLKVALASRWEPRLEPQLARRIAAL